MAANINIVMLAGNLTRDPEVKYTPSGTAICQIGLAVNRRYRDSRTNEMREEVTFVDVELWGRSAETAGQYLSKGRPVMIEGRLRLDQWDDKQTGQKRSKLKVVAERFHFMGGGPGGEGGGQGGGSQGGGGQRTAPRPLPPRPAGVPTPQGGGGRKAPQQQAPHDDQGEPQGGPDGGDSDLDIPQDNIPF